MLWNRKGLAAAGFVTAFVTLGLAQAIVERVAAAQARDAVQAPRFEVDPFWPKPLPNHWLLGSTIGTGSMRATTSGSSTAVRPRSTRPNGAPSSTRIADCCNGAPPVLQFDQAGQSARLLGRPGPGYEWPQSNHGIFVDHKGIVWIGGNGGGDSHVLKFTQDGKFIAQFGKQNARLVAGDRRQADSIQRGSNDPNSFGRVAKIFVEPKANEAYLSDGYFNTRVAVLDADTGKMKRYWGAYGNKPDDVDLGPYKPDAPPAQQFRNPVHCADVSNDGFVYVCDRVNDRIQVFRPEGKFVKEGFIAKNTLASGSVWDVAFSRDPQQRYLLRAPTARTSVSTSSIAVAASAHELGDGGRQPGQFFGAHSIAIDSQGNLYMTETYEGKRVQKFVYKGLGPVTSQNQSVWPTR